MNHRHFILTIDEGLRDVFLLHSHLLKDLVDEGAKFIKEFFEKKAKETPGIIVGLHIFGSKVNYNPRAYACDNGRNDKNGEWKGFDFLPFKMLRKQWQTIVLKFTKEIKGESEKAGSTSFTAGLLSKWRRFYVYAPKQRGKIKGQLRYIGRYLRRPAIAYRGI